VVENITTEHEINGSNPASTWEKEKITTGTKSNGMNLATTWEDVKLMDENFITMPIAVAQW
jgi:hypothetical protein